MFRNYILSYLTTRHVVEVEEQLSQSLQIARPVMRFLRL